MLPYNPHLHNQPPSRTFPTACWVACLRHKVPYDSVEDAPVIVALQTQLHKVAHSLWGVGGEVRSGEEVRCGGVVVRMMI